MLNDLKPQVLLFLGTVVVAVIAATVVLVVSGFGESAATIGTVLALVIPLLIGQAKAREQRSEMRVQVAEVHDKVDTILNGGGANTAQGIVDRDIAAGVAQGVAAAEAARHPDDDPKRRPRPLKPL